MRSIKKLLITTSVFFFVSGSSLFFYAQTGNITLTLKNIDGTSAPLPPVLLSPSNLETEVSTTPSLSWAASIGASSYQVQISTTSSFSSNIFDLSGITVTSLNVTSALSDGTTYFWRVNATNLGGTSNWSVRSFTTMINETRIPTRNFAGLKWNVSNGVSGPGPNNWFNGINSIWIDNSENLHLTIRKIGDKWYCSSIYAQDTTGYGEYSFSVSSNVELYDPNIIVGLFIYENDSTEIDIEFSRWGDAGSNAGLYVVQPSEPLISSHSFPLNLTASSSTHKFTWTKQGIKFQSYQASGDLIKEWSYRGSNIPIPNQLKPHINFWLMKGLAPINQKDAELIISNFKYTPIHLLTDVSKDEVVPTEFKLYQNYPNPFNPNTKINFTLTRSSHVSLKVYNLLGQEKAQLINKELSVGYHEVSFDGSAFPSGVYLYRIKTGDFIQSKKMILLK
ncbi:MAG: T9SS type A sorting domain-containing protein [Ignavibacteriales bacterium]|nr:T9SS type A sorting domain-containing protein [Ignavibacteriales bacterium]